MQTVECNKLRNSASKFNPNPTPRLDPVPNPNPILHLYSAFHILP